MPQSQKTFFSVFDSFSKKVTKATGSPWAFFTAMLIVVVWAILGPVFGFSDTWQLVINTGTTIITFLMVFVIQQSQNKDTVALHLKLNELIASSEKASNRLVDIEDLTEEELDKLKRFYITLSELAENEDDSFASHSIDEAKRNHCEKVVEKSDGVKKQKQD
ncbi:low affinity iron permease family protein [Rurimicrobium arvi]|uniref:Low affinity iron permease family protein n=1 Tax=Rurimicrobium arvi TaxID=2049916 RepID=A0ABP8MIH8_9BACT